MGPAIQERRGRLAAGEAVALACATLLVVSALAVVRMLLVDDARAATPEQAADPRPNVVLFVLDDMRADDLRFLPKATRLIGRAGVRYTNAIAPQPLCCPTRAQLVTGQYGQSNGVKYNTGPWGGSHALRGRDNTLPVWMSQAGYRTYYTGKYLNGYRAGSGAKPEPGWTDWDAQVSGMYNYTGPARFADGDVYRGRHITDIIRNRSAAAIGRLAGTESPFLAVINHVAPHGTVYRRNGRTYPIPTRRYADAYRRARPPLLRSPAFNERDVRDLPADLRGRKVRTARIVELWRARARALRSTDDAIASTLRLLRRTGELDDTYVILTSDNGYNLGEHRQQGKNLLSDESLDVPLLVRGPGIAPGTVDRSRVSLVDLPATIVDWAGIQPSRPLDGISLTRPVARLRDTILVQTGDTVRDATPGWHYRGVTTARYLFGTRAGHPGIGILFDRKRDPHALDNVFDDRAYARVRRELLRRTRILSRCSGTACNQVFGRLPAPRG